mmetsp:Transcript_27308/g.40018  ORF Transcript_27308/g.40018 Transcript_27308/m.40018 type:complete len:473 (+) Transcript_27308:144-1562(+)
MAAKKSRKSKTAPKDEVVADVPPPTTSSSTKKKKKTKATTTTTVATSGEVKSSKKKKQQKVVEPEPAESEESDDDDMKLTLEALDDISDESDDEEQGDDGEDEDVAEATARLRQMIEEGQFDGLLKQNKKKGKKDDVVESEEDLEEEELDVGMNEEVDEEDNEEDNEEEEQLKDDNEDSEDESEEEEEAETEQSSKQLTQAIALASALEGTDRHLPWPETFTVVPPTPLPFGSLNDDDVGGKKRKRSEESDEDDEEEYVDVHDDLKREVAFYDNAMEAVRMARSHCENAGIPFTRPEDFFAEMIKTDDHMAKIKDRLIFETKKIEAVERRKSNKEQTVMAKERAAHRIAEKSKAKKAHMSAVEDWKKSAEQGRGRLGGKVHDMDADEDQLRGLGGGPNNKRMNADKRYGFGGKRGRFKQNDPKDLNDMSGFKPRGSFPGGQKTTNSFGKGKKGGGGGGAKRPGKRARDAKRK